tara:strand:- start:803 stop:1246 length:444 start_codon:yes stop_codon:yes gene_type:complete
MSEQLTQLFETEVERRVNERITAFAMQVSESYRIPISLLLRDAGNPNLSETAHLVNTCLGVKKNGQRCKFKATDSGYCKHHQEQKKKLHPIEVKNVVEHNHSVPPLYQDGCPACALRTPRLTPSNSQVSLGTPKKSVIDFNLLVDSR